MERCMGECMERSLERSMDGQLPLATIDLAGDNREFEV